MTQTEQIAAQFSPIAQDVEAFAVQHGFEVGKCLRGNSGWELSREHPDGGFIYLLLLHNDDNGLGIGSTWQVDCPEMATQYSHFRAIRGCDIEANAVIDRLKCEMEELSRVKYGHWTHMRSSENKEYYGA